MRLLSVGNYLKVGLWVDQPTGITQGGTIKNGMKISAAGLAAALIALGASAAPAAAKDGTDTSRAAVDAKLQEVVGCTFTAEAPGKLTTSTMVGAGRIKTCTTPKPGSCRLQVSIMKGVSTIAHKDGGWGACKKTLGPTHKCSNLVSKVVYYTESILQVEYKGQHDCPEARQPGNLVNERSLHRIQPQSRPASRALRVSLFDKVERHRMLVPGRRDVNAVFTGPDRRLQYSAPKLPQFQRIRALYFDLTHC
ncbi:hypothetical protein OG210_01960 [Streptomyces sp. NBC_00466]